MYQPQTIRLQQGEWAIYEQLATNSTSQIFFARPNPAIDASGARTSDARLMVKRIRLDPVDARFVSLIKQRLNAISALEVDGVARLIDYDVQADTVYLVREQVDSTLALCLVDEPMTIDRIIAIFRQLCHAVMAVHREGILHLNLKPENVLCDDENNLLSLTDFALYTGAIGDTIYGTPCYLAPEQLRDDPVGQYTDVYALGLILYRMLTGSSATGNASYMSPHQIIDAQLHDIPLLPSHHNPDISPMLERVMMRALAKMPQTRYSTVETLLSAVIQAHSGEQVDGMNHSQKTRSISPIAYPFIVAIIFLCLMIALSFLASQSASIQLDPIPLSSLIEKDQSTAFSRLEVTRADVKRAVSRIGSEGFVAYITCTRDTEYHAVGTMTGYYIVASVSTNAIDSARALVDSMILLLAERQITGIVEVAAGNVVVSPMMNGSIE